MASKNLKFFLFFFFIILSSLRFTFSLTCFSSGVYPLSPDSCVYILPINSSLEEGSDLLNQCQRFNENQNIWYLPKIDSKSKHDALKSIFQTKLSSGRRKIFRIGLKRDEASQAESRDIDQWQTPSKWRWLSDGTTLDTSFKNEQVPWTPGEPNNHNNVDERCVVAYSDLDLKWNDAVCSFGYRLATNWNYDLLLICESKRGGASDASERQENGADTNAQENSKGKSFGIGFLVGALVICVIIGGAWFGRRYYLKKKAEKLGGSVINFIPNEQLT